jgi:hypothetical protein
MAGSRKRWKIIRARQHRQHKNRKLAAKMPQFVAGLQRVSVVGNLTIPTLTKLATATDQVVQAARTMMRTPLPVGQTAVPRNDRRIYVVASNLAHFRKYTDSLQPPTQIDPVQVGSPHLLRGINGKMARVVELEGWQRGRSTRDITLYGQMIDDLPRRGVEVDFVDMDA